MGSHDEEIARLGLQHRVWQARAMAAWHAACIGAGQTVLDVGCGPGYASLDLAELTGPGEKVVAIDRSERFLAVLETAGRERQIHHITTYRTDLDRGEFPQRAPTASGAAGCSRS